MLKVDVRKTLGEFQMNVTFSTEDSGVTAFFGPSGAGKTSVINMVAGLLEPDQGQISIDNEAIFDSGKRINLA
ncbi:MAG: ATP-binding cassette domain-containing protein, partial [Pseudomonadota bacterium]